MRLLPFGLLLLAFSFIGFGQTDQFTIQLRNGDFTPQVNSTEFIASPNFSAEELVNGSYFRLIQFEETPSKQTIEELAAAGINLCGYLSNKAYYASIKQNANLNVLASNAVRSIIQLEQAFILSEALYSKKYPDWALSAQGRIELTAIHFELIAEVDAIAALKKSGAEITQASGAGLISFICPIADLDRFYSIPGFYYFETIDAPEQKEGYRDVSNHRSNYINNPVGVGKGYTGNGVTIMMQDDGTIGPHIDYQGRITTVATGNDGDHGDHVAGIIMGAGNLNPDAVGNAPGAHLLVYGAHNGNYSAVPDLYMNEGLVITSKSYGDGNNAGYTGLSRQLDEQCHELDALVHVFSAGNSGAENFGYGAGPGWGNITGGHKQGKNVLAVGNLSDQDELNFSSSRGPAEDGRIKPNICAVGTDVYSTIDPNTYGVKTGTSMSCPGVAGSIALLYEAYRDLNGGLNPSAALINAAVMNTGEDLGNPGPDFRFGYGRINTKRAYELIEAGNYQASTINDSEIKAHAIEVPEGTKQVRIMLYWTDYPANPVVLNALVNDIDMTVTDPASMLHQPWVLNPTPSPALLNNDAEPDEDHLNNMEQITIDNPSAGTHTVNIAGFDIPEGPQRYVIVYEFVKDEIEIIYPVGGESIKAGSSELVRWDAFGTDEDFILEYSLDGGLTWDQIGSSISGELRSASWGISSSVLTGEGLVRVSRGAVSGQSKAHFSIMRQPQNLDVEWACPQAFNFSWNPVSGAIGYEVFLLGEKYMDSVGYTTETNMTVYANSMEPQWFSVRAIGPNNCIGKRAVAVLKSPYTADCTMEPPVANITSVCNTIGPGSCVQFSDISTNAGQGAAWEWSFPGGTPATSNLEHPYVCYDTEGNYDVSLTVKNGVGEDHYTWTQYVQVVKGNELPFSEDFEAGQLSDDWALENENTSLNWRIDNSVSAYNKGSKAIVFENFANTTVGATASFTSPQIDLTSTESIMELSFDLAYANGVNTNDSLRVYISNDCGVTKSLLFASGGTALATANVTNSPFIPQASEWRFEAVSLAEFKTWTSASFIFENYSANGNALYLDNINLRVSEENFSADLITVFPNPFSNEISIAGLVDGEQTTIRIHSAKGNLVYDNTFEAQKGTIVLDTDHFASGAYIIEITSASKSHQAKLIKVQ